MRFGVVSVAFLAIPSIHDGIKRSQVLLLLSNSKSNGGINKSNNVNNKKSKENIMMIENKADDDDDDLFTIAVRNVGFSEKIKSSIEKALEKAEFDGSHELALLARDFVTRPEGFSSILQSDFEMNAITAHRIRVIAMEMIHIQNKLWSKKNVVQHETQKNDIVEKVSSNMPFKDRTDTSTDGQTLVVNEKERINNSEKEKLPSQTVKSNEKRPKFKAVVVNEKAKRRNEAKNDYGLSADYEQKYPLLAKELEEFYTFMTIPSTRSQEQPIRPETAKVYMRHAKLFLGWYIGTTTNDNNDTDQSQTNITINSIIPNKEKESANIIIDFIVWLRTTRNISVSYEANILRGLVKFLKFQFASESQSDPSYGEKTFDDIPVIREIRKLHRDANKRQRVSPKSSQEELKWLSWQEYLGVVQDVKQDLQNMLQSYEQMDDDDSPLSSKRPTPKQVANLYQQYLVLAFFANVPDRQRTIRELEIGRSLVKVNNNNNADAQVWAIKHGPDDYKTGKTYGDRPLLFLSPALTPAINEFISQWRPHLNTQQQANKADKETHYFLFCQPRTGKPLTQDSVYQIVGRNCFKYTGKRTNPHLLRDMIVTHVREHSDASEKELEALALYMGHSIHMQRTSYDRRTLTKKVAPAVELLQSVNKDLNNDKKGSNE